MKNKTIILITIIFFLVINTSYFWEGKLDLWAIPVFSVLVVVFGILLISWADQLYRAVKEKFFDKRRIYLVLLLTIVLSLTVYKPGGIVNFESLSGYDLLVAAREGSANCLTTIKLKSNHRFVEKIVCFGITETKGDFRIINDTICFSNIKTGRGNYSFYKFAVIRPSVYFNDSSHFDLVLLEERNDSSGKSLLITKNELAELKE